MEDSFKVVAIFLIYQLPHVIGFNVIVSPKTYRFSPGNQKDFGYSVALASFSNRNGVYVGSPNSNADDEETGGQRDGSVYYCPIHDELEKVNGHCRNLNLMNNNHSDGKANHSTLLSVDFEGYQPLKQMIDIDDFNWTEHQGETQTHNTGPHFDHTYAAGKKGHYMLLESSSRSVGASAMMATPELPQSTGSCLRFWYHMRGRHLGNLNVYVSSALLGTKIVWTKSGHQNDTWHEGWTSVITEEPYKILFEGVVGPGYESDMGLDDIVLYQGLCVEDELTEKASLGMTLKVDKESGSVLACAPTWTYSCKDHNQMAGLCYLLTGGMESANITMMSPCRYPSCNDEKMDLVFLIDGSDSIHILDFRKMILSLSNIVSSLPIVKNLTQIGIAQYSSSPRTEFKLNQYHKLDDFRKAVRNISHMGGRTETGKALNYVNSEMFNETNGMRPDAKHVAVVITDGKSQDIVIAAADELKRRGIKIFAIGVSSADVTELNDISSDPDHQFVFSVSSYKALDGVRSQLSEKLIALESQSDNSTLATSQCQAGLSAGFVAGKPMIGIPGLHDWSGGFISFSADHLQHREIDLNDILDQNNQCTIPQNGSCFAEDIRSPTAYSYFGSSMCSGSYTGTSERQMAVGSPRLKSAGGVFIIDVSDSENPTFFKLFVGDQIGSDFGYSVCLTDMNGDGMDELLVGSPLFFDKNPDEGLVTIFVSDSTGVSENRQKVNLFGSRESSARFGLSIAAAGDLNGDGVGDIVIGAPGGYNVEGAVYIYNGKSNLNVNLQPSQMIKSSSFESKPDYFGFSVSSGNDVDQNQYPDVAVGAPGSGEAFVLLTRPVMHVVATILSIPETVNISRSTCFLPQKFVTSFTPKACSSLKICFSIHGRNLPRVTLLEYELLVDEVHSRATSVNPRNEIVPSTSVSCVTETLAFKESIHDFSDVQVGVRYRLSSKLNYTEEAVMLDVYDENPVYTKIKLSRWCKRPGCESNLKLISEFEGLSLMNGAESLLIGQNKILTLGVTLQNSEDIALESVVRIFYHRGLYFSHITQADVACVTVDNTRSSETNTSNFRCYGASCTDEASSMKQVLLKLINPIMKPMISCKFRLKFGIADENVFYKENLTVSLQSRSSSKDFDESDNDNHISLPLYFQTKTSLKGYPSMHNIRLAYPGNTTNNTASLSDIGPNVGITYFISNVGFWKIPKSSLQIKWPNSTTDHLGILYPVRIECMPSDKCVCQEKNNVFNPTNLTEFEDFEINSTENGNNVTLNYNVHKEVLLDCDQGTAECSESICVVSDFYPQDVVQLTVNFRVWERTIFDLQAWKATIVTYARFTAKSDEYRISQQPYSAKVTFSALTLDDDPNDNSGIEIRLWIIIVAVCVGLLLLALLILLLYKAKFFESKYRQKKEESLTFRDYKYATFQEGRIKVQLKAEAGKETVITRMSTFQR